MLRGLLKDKKAYDYSNNKGKGKKMGLQYAPNSPYYARKNELESEKIFNSQGLSISGKITKKIDNNRIKSPELTFSPSKKMFPDKLVKSSRTLNPNLQSMDSATHNMQVKYFAQSNISKIYSNYTNTRPTDILNVKKKELKREKSGKKIVSMNRYKSFELSDEPVEFKVNKSIGKR